MTTEENAPIDAEFSIVIKPDGMQAHLTLTPAQHGGKKIAYDTIIDRLVELGVVDGKIDEDAIKTAVHAGQGNNLLIAYGRAAENGKDGWFEPLVEIASSRVPREDAEGRIDYLDLGDMPSVQEGEALMRCHKPGAGEDGVNLFGKRVAAREGKAVVFAANLAGTKISPEDNTLLLAACGGMPVEVNGGMTVEPVYKIKNVSIATGHIRFDGTVEVAGDIAADMCVEATGDIIVGGVVEPATLKAGGNITVKGGVLGVQGGRKAGGESSIECDGSFSAIYAQQAKIKAGDRILIDDLAMQCELEAGHSIQIGEKRRGVVIGGRLIAATSITGKVFGSADQVHTVLEVGNEPDLYKQRTALDKARSNKEDRVLEISKLIAFAQKNKDKVKAAVVDKARATNAALLEKINTLRAEREAVEARIKIVEQSRVFVQELAYVGVEVRLAGQFFHLNSNIGGCTIGLGEDGLGILEE